MKSKEIGVEERINKKFSESELAPYGIKARVVDGVVYLQGVVDLFAEKEEAENLVRSEPEVKRVVNAITVCTDGAIDDEDVQFEVTEELLGDPQISRTVGSRVSKGKVRLVGEVTSLAEEEAAIKAAGRARGVREVISDLQIAEDYEIDETDLINKVKETMAGDNPALARAVSVRARQGVITISGTVGGSEEIKHVEELVSRVAGVKRVVNNLQTKPETLSEAVIEMLDRLSADPFLRDAKVSYSWENGQLVIDGEVHSHQEKKRVEKALHQVLEEMQREIPMVENRLRLIE